MNSLECIRTRRSVRKFTEQKVPHELLEELVETARFAPAGRTPRSSATSPWRMRR